MIFIGVISGHVQTQNFGYVMRIYNALITELEVEMFNRLQRVARSHLWCRDACGVQI